MKKKMITVLTVIFMVAMVVLTFAARPIHRLRLPHVSTIQLTQKTFSYTHHNANGESLHITKRNLAIAKDLYQTAGIYVVENTVINGETRTVARKVYPVIGDGWHEDYFEITSGIRSGQLLILDADRDFYDGDEVHAAEVGQ